MPTAKGDKVTNNRRGPKPVVEYGGQIYSARKYDIEVPDLDSMSRLEALVWLNQNTSWVAISLRRSGVASRRQSGNRR